MSDVESKKDMHMVFNSTYRIREVAKLFQRSGYVCMYTRQFASRKESISTFYSKNDMKYYL